MQESNATNHLDHGLALCFERVGRCEGQAGHHSKVAPPIFALSRTSPAVRCMHAWSGGSRRKSVMLAAHHQGRLRATEDQDGVVVTTTSDGRLDGRRSHRTAGFGQPVFQIFEGNMGTYRSLLDGGPSLVRTASCSSCLLCKRPACTWQKHGEKRSGEKGSGFGIRLGPKLAFSSSPMI